MGFLLKGAIITAIISALILLVFPDIYLTVNKVLNQLLSNSSPVKPSESSKSVNTAAKCVPPNQKLFTRQLLAKYDGTPQSLGIYLAFLGSVYDVSKGAHHYKPGGSYSFFAGKDATRAFITGEFTEEGLTDDLNGLDAQNFDGIKTWVDLYETDYKKVGRVVGTYYDENGCETEAMKWVYEQIEANNAQKSVEQEELKVFPYCNSEWSANEKSGRVWCTSLSGGTQRDWVGVPRQLFMPDKKQYRCACVRDTGSPSVPAIVYDDDMQANDGQSSDDNSGDLGNPRLKLYDGCDKDSVECKLKD